MKTILVNVRLPDVLYSETKLVAEMAGYANVQEFIKDAIRHKLSDIKKEMSILMIDRDLKRLERGKRKILARTIREDRFERVRDFIDKVKGKKA